MDRVDEAALEGADEQDAHQLERLLELCPARIILVGVLRPYARHRSCGRLRVCCTEKWVIQGRE